MRTLLLLSGLAVGTTLALAPTHARAANADHPYQNVDHSNDNGNNTGDSKVEGLNAAQLDENQKPPYQQSPSIVVTQPPGTASSTVITRPAR